jgi:hypothetical protein
MKQFDIEMLNATGVIDHDQTRSRRWVLRPHCHGWDPLAKALSSNDAAA